MEVGPVGPTSVEFGGSVVTGPVAPVGPVVGEEELGEVSVDAAVLVSGGVPDVGIMVGDVVVTDGVGPGPLSPGRVGVGRGAVGNGAVGLPGEVVELEVSSELVSSPMSVVWSTSPPPAEWSWVPEVRPPQPNVVAAPQTPNTTDQPKPTQERFLTRPLSLNGTLTERAARPTTAAENTRFHHLHHVPSRLQANRASLLKWERFGAFRSVPYRNACASSRASRNKFTL